MFGFAENNTKVMMTVNNQIDQSTKIISSVPWQQVKVELELWIFIAD